MEVQLDQLIVDPAMSPRAGIDHSWIEELAENVDQFEPVTVVDTADGTYLADGFHRYYAAQRRGQDKLPAVRHKGTREDAHDLAVILNMRHGMKLSHEEKRAAVLNFAAWHSDLSNREIARRLGVAFSFVDDVVVVKRETEGLEQTLPFSHEVELARSDLSPETRRQLREAAAQQPWRSQVELREAIQTVSSPRVAEGYKQRVLRREVPPVTFTASGEPAFSQQQISEMAADVLEGDVRVKFANSWRAATEMDLLDQLEVLATADKGTLEMVIQNGPRHVAWVQRLVDLAREKLEVIGQIDD